MLLTVSGRLAKMDKMNREIPSLLVCAFISFVFSLRAWAADNPLTGVIDFHCHSGPDALQRSVSDLEIARIAKRAGMRGLVFKNHFTSTAARAELVRHEVPSRP